MLLFESDYAIFNAKYWKILLETLCKSQVYDYRQSHVPRIDRA